jgi:glucose/arabinose dehydrogenase
MKRVSAVIIGASGCLLASASFGADAVAGKALFAQRCSICHTAESGDNGGAQGPSLIGLMGRTAGGAPQFSYTAALRDSKLTWDAATLRRFLASPSTVVPGTSMLIAVPAESERNDLVAYFQSVATQAAPSVAAPSPVPASSMQSANWRLDAPGRVHHITAESLPPPFATASSRNNSSVVAKPAAAALALPPGFRIDSFASGLAGPRKMAVAPNGDIFITEMRGGKVSVMHPSTDGTHAASTEVYAEGLKQPFGLAFYPNAKAPHWLYVAETNRVTRYAYRVGDVKPAGAAQIVIPQLPSGVGHSTRDIAFSLDGKRLFVSVGSGSNVAESMPKKTPAEIKSWEVQHGFGSSWDSETERAAVLEFEAAAPAASALYASGIRNCVSLTVQPANGALWCTTNERDALGDDLVPDYSTRVARGSFYGWPWYYIGSNQDPRLKGERPDLAGKVAIPDVLYQSHSAALSMTFYAASSGKSAFPADFTGDAIVGFHGSWNRSLRTGYKLVRVRMKNGEPTGDYEDFLTGFVVDDAHVWGRPVATVELPDGSLLMSEDGNNIVYRISYSHEQH